MAVAAEIDDVRWPGSSLPELDSPVEVTTDRQTESRLKKDPTLCEGILLLGCVAATFDLLP